MRRQVKRSTVSNALASAAIRYDEFSKVLEGMSQHALADQFHSQATEARHIARWLDAGDTVTFIDD